MNLLFRLRVQARKLTTILPVVGFFVVGFTVGLLESPGKVGTRVGLAVVGLAEVGLEEVGFAVVGLEVVGLKVVGFVVGLDVGSLEGIAVGVEVEGMAVGVLEGLAVVGLAVVGAAVGACEQSDTA